MENQTIENVKLFMKRKSLNQCQTASILGINKYTLNRWLKGKKTPSKAYERLIFSLLKETI